MTLFYDADSKTFLEKQMQISGMLMNDLDEVERQLGKTVLNIAEYIDEKSTQKFLLQVELLDSKQRSCLLKFHVNIQKQDDDSRSVQTRESNQHLSENGEKKRESKEKNNKVKRVNQIFPSQTSSRKSFNTDTKILQSTKKSKEIEFSLSKEKQIKNKAQLPPKSPTIDEKTQKNVKNKPKEEPQQFKFEVQNTRKVNSSQQKSFQMKKESFPVSPISSKPPKPEKSQQIQKQQPQTVEVKMFVYQKRMKDKQKQLKQFKKQIQDQKKIIQDLLQEKHKKPQSSQVAKYTRQIQSLKNQLLNANIKLSQFETVNRNYQIRDQQNSRIIEKQYKQITYYKSLAERQKMRMASIMQKCLQSGDNDLIAFMEEQAQNDEDFD